MSKTLGQKHKELMRVLKRMAAALEELVETLNQEGED